MLILKNVGIINPEGVLKMTKFEKNSIVTGCVTGIESYGIFVNLDDYYNGLIHISEISNDYVKNITDYANIGETIKMKVLEVDEKRHHVKLSIKNISYKSDNVGKIEETSNGFNTLKAMIPIWISSEINKDIYNK